MLALNNYVILLIIVLIFAELSRRSIAETVVTCDHEYLIASCPSDTVLIFDEAVYGRTDVTTCTGTPPVKVGDVTVDLRTDVTDCRKSCVVGVLNEKCFGRTRCKVLVNQWMMSGDPCPGTRRYLNATYHCVPENEVSYVCDGRYQTKPKVRSKGYLVSRRYPDAHEDNLNCVAVIEAAYGYRFNLRVIDLKVESRNGVGCYDWLTIEDFDNVARTHHFCGELCNVHTNETTSLEQIRKATVYFKTNGQVAYKGFIVRYEEVEEKRSNHEDL